MVEEGEHPLIFWKKQEKNFPHLSLFAKNYLTISASSVPVEAMFSTCGLMLNVKRNSMAPCRANILSVIHDNYPKFLDVQASKTQLQLLTLSYRLRLTDRLHVATKTASLTHF